MLSSSQKNSIQETLKKALINKIKNYNPEPASMPFHTRLLGKDRLALYSFIHSLNTNFGTSIFEPVAITLAKNKFCQSTSQEIIRGEISEKAQFEIQKIIDNLKFGKTKPNKIEEIELIRQVCQQGKMREVKLTKVDVYLQNSAGELFLFDLKTAKPNKGGFIEFKRTLLEWSAVILAANPQTKVNTLIAIPYNPYEPKPYSRWTMAGMLDLKNELKVADEFWDFLGGKGAYKALLSCFEEVGIELRTEIDDYFKRYSNI